MIIIYEDEIYHTDNCEDIIEHHGIKGMKWGQRLRGNYVVGSGTANRAQKKILRLQKRNKRTAFNKTKDIAEAVAYRDEYSKIKDGYNKRSTPAKEAWKKSIAKNGRSDINTKIAKLKFKAAKSRDRADEWRHKVGGKKTTTEEVMGYYNASRYDMKAKKLARKKG